MKKNQSTPIEHGLTLNSLEVILNKNILTLQKAEYSQDLFRKYVENNDYYIHRYEEDMYIWALRQTDERLHNSFNKVEVTIEKHAPIFTKIIERAIVTFFEDNSYEIYKRRHSSIWELELKKEEEGSFGALTLRPTLVFSLRNLYSRLERKQVIALTIRKRGKPIFTGNEDQIKEHLTDTRGLVRNHKGDIVGSRENTKRYLEATGQNEDFARFLSEIESSCKEFNYIKECPEHFKKISPKLYLPSELEILDFLLVNLPSASFESFKISKPIYYYYNETTRTGYYNQMVSQLKPFSFDVFSTRKLNILVVSKGENEGSVGEFLVLLQSKLKDIFHIDNLEFQLKIAPTSKSYIDLLGKVDAKDYDLAIIVLSQRDKAINTLYSPYYLL